MWAVWSITVGEAGSATIAIDALWRSFGFPSRGRKRVILFGASRIVVIYFVLNGISSMSSRTSLKLWMDDEEVGSRCDSFTPTSDLECLNCNSDEIPTFLTP